MIQLKATGFASDFSASNVYLNHDFSVFSGTDTDVRIAPLEANIGDVFSLSTYARSYDLSIAGNSYASGEPSVSLTPSRTRRQFTGNTAAVGAGFDIRATLTLTAADEASVDVLVISGPGRGIYLVPLSKITHQVEYTLSKFEKGVEPRVANNPAEPMLRVGKTVISTEFSVRPGASAVVSRSPSRDQRVTRMPRQAGLG